MHVLQALKSIEYLEEEDAQQPAEGGRARVAWLQRFQVGGALAAGGVSGLLGQVWAFSLLGFYFSFRYT